LYGFGTDFKIRFYLQNPRYRWAKNSLNIITQISYDFAIDRKLRFFSDFPFLTLALCLKQFFWNLRQSSKADCKIKCILGKQNRRNEFFFQGKISEKIANSLIIKALTQNSTQKYIST
jgi:predicted nucleic acid-binding protein